jgi:hypothetical protein
MDTHRSCCHEWHFSHCHCAVPSSRPQPFSPQRQLKNQVSPSLDALFGAAGDAGGDVGVGAAGGAEAEGAEGGGARASGARLFGDGLMDGLGVPVRFFLTGLTFSRVVPGHHWSESIVYARGASSGFA